MKKLASEKGTYSEVTARSC